MMKNTQLLTLVILISTSSMALASGMHGGGHDSGKSASMKSHWMSPPAEASKVNPIKLSSESVAKGAQLYQQNCVSCHGATAEGNGMAGMMLTPKPANLRAMSGGHPDGDFAYKIREGRGAMPAWKNALNDKQVWHLVNYIQTLNKQPVAHKEQTTEHSDDHSHGS